MAFNFPAGSRFQFSSTFAPAKTISALSNANPAVATSTAHGYTTNDEILLTSGWEDATDSVYKVTVIDANSFSLQGLDAAGIQSSIEKRFVVPADSARPALKVVA